MTAPQPFDPGYDYDADRPVEEKLVDQRAVKLPEPMLMLLLHQAAGEIRALRKHVNLTERQNRELRLDIEHLTSKELEL